MMNVSIIVPVYNEEDNIIPLARELAGVSGRIPGLEVIFVDDGSTDGTWKAIAEAGAALACVRGIRCARNRGQSSAMLAGLQNAEGDVMVTIDGDRQNNPSDIPQLVEALKDCDVVCGYRAKRRDSWGRRVGSRLANTVRAWFTQDGIRDTGCSLKAFKRECVEDLPPFKGVHRFMPAYFRLNGRKIMEVPVDHRPRVAGTSKYTNLKRLPATVFDLVGFAWYRRRYQRRLAGPDLSRTESKR
ncbi:MAG: glycosyltransferase [Verrucomicrobia bacterium]|nr:glycosyltransferase [Verrucomicrobiota bacterium]